MKIIRRDVLANIQVLSVISEDGIEHYQGRAITRYQSVHNDRFFSPSDTDEFLKSIFDQKDLNKGAYAKKCLGSLQHMKPEYE